MKRLIDYHLIQWKNHPLRQPLLLRGARQVGKTHAARELGKTFESFVEINLEELERSREVFNKDLTAKDLLIGLEAATLKSIKPGKTLLFLDEIQAAPRAILALRYFYEQMPDLHVIAAGSLLDFALEKVGIPVGRVQSLYVYPLTFIEYLVATGSGVIVQHLFDHDSSKEFSPAAHTILLDALGRYLALGGMPQVLQCWIEKQEPLLCTQLQSRVIANCRQDFGKYALAHQIKYVDLVFEAVPAQLGKQFRYSEVEGDYRKRELAPALDLLDTAGIVHKVFFSPSQGIPLGAEANPLDYKALLLDNGLAQQMLHYDLAGWFINPLQEFVNKGQLVEAFIGLELIGYSDPHKEKKSFYWHRAERTSQAEVDYVIQMSDSIVPVEVKSGKGNTLKSLHMFLELHKKSRYGIKFSTNNFSRFETVHAYPLYAVFKLLLEGDPELRKAVESLF